MIRYQFLDESLREEDIHPGQYFENERKLAYQYVNSLKSGERIEYLSGLSGRKAGGFFLPSGDSHMPFVLRLGRLAWPVCRTAHHYQIFS